MNRSNSERVRSLIGESIPPGKVAADTMFSEDEIEDLLEEGNNDPNAAAYFGWREKAANYASLVDVNEGNAARMLSDLHRQAIRMMDRYVGYIETPSRGRTRMGKIVRERN